jgi:DNA polymerase III subunit alpha
VSFVHLHVHSNFSQLDGGSKIENYAEKAAQDRQPAMAVTDHGNVSGLPDLERAAAKYGVKMIPGCELYMARRSVTERPASRNTKDDESEVGKKYHHLTTLALNQTGYQNLIELSSRSFLDDSAFYFKPRIDFEMLADHSEGLLVTSSCLGGVVLQDIMHENMAGAEESVQMFVDIFGRDRFCIEVQDHDIPEQHKTNPILFDLAKKYKLRVVATADAHYLNVADAPFHDALLCSQTSSTVASTNRFKFNGHGHYLKTAEEIRWDWRTHHHHQLRFLPPTQVLCSTRFY